MERASQFKSRVIIGVIAVGFFGMQGAYSDTVFLPARQPEQDPRQGPVEQFPESRFGMAPMRIETGVGTHYAAQAVTEMEGSDEGDAVPASSGRSPAGLDFSSGHLVRRNPEASSAAQGSRRPSPPQRDLERDLAPVVYSQASVGETLSSAVSRHGVQEVALIASDLGFFPRTVFVSRDVPVRLFVTGASKNTLCIMMDSFQIRKQIRSQKIEEITFTPATPGKYRYYCPVNGMEGTMIVKELSTDSRGGAGAERSVARVANDE